MEMPHGVDQWWLPAMPLPSALPHPTSQLLKQTRNSSQIVILWIVVLHLYSLHYLSLHILCSLGLVLPANWIAMVSDLYCLPTWTHRSQMWTVSFSYIHQCHTSTIPISKSLLMYFRSIAINDSIWLCWFDEIVEKACQAVSVRCVMFQVWGRVCWKSLNTRGLLQEGRWDSYMNRACKSDQREAEGQVTDIYSQ